MAHNRQTCSYTCKEFIIVLHRRHERAVRHIADHSIGFIDNHIDLKPAWRSFS